MLQLLSLFLLLPASALADVVKVRWDVNFTTEGRVVRHRTPKQYYTTLAKCGHSPKSARLDYLSVQTLRCKGVLNFSESASINKKVQHAIQETIRRGNKKVAGLALSDLLKQSKSVKFAVSPYGIFESADTTNSRNFAINLPKEKLVILNKIYWDQIKNSPDNILILLHELLGALGYNDQDYRHSLQISGYGKGGDTQLASREDSGGASVVGNGGDSNEAIYKASLIRWARKMKFDLNGLENRAVPSRRQLEKFFVNTPLILMPTAYMMQNGVCDPLTGAPQSRQYCGTFNLKGSGGRPAILITEDIGDFSPKGQEQLLLFVFQQAYYHLIWKNEGK